MFSYHPNFRRVSVGAPDKIKPGAENLGLLKSGLRFYLIKVSFVDVLAPGGVGAA